MNERKPLSYRDAGVDIDAASDALSRTKELIRSTLGPDCLSAHGSFGGLFRVPVEDYEAPVLVSSTDGVGTKVKIATMTGRHDSVGRDIVNHCVNDILVQGARPLFFLDYLGCDRLDGDVFEQLLRGLATACRENGCALIGGETAEMGDTYGTGEYDLVGTVVGVVDRSKILDGSRVEPGDRLIGLPSTGLHTNGYTLARKIAFERARLEPDSRVEGIDGTIADALLAVHRSYRNEIAPLLEDDLIHALAHVTGGGLTDNVPRVLPEGASARIELDAWEVPPLFRFLAEHGPVERDECLRTFNMGVGMVVIAGRDRAEEVVDRLATAGAGPFPIGEVVEGGGEVLYA